MNNQTNFYLSQLRPLLGATITKLVRTGTDKDDSADDLFGLLVTLPDGSKKTMLLLSDDEGNGPGSFEISDCV